MKKCVNIFFAAMVIQLLLSVEVSFAQYNIPEKMKWWYEDRFGMFIHFGSYSYLGHGEWAFATEKWTKANYQTRVSSKFNPAKFDAGVIARLAQKAGMKYLVITAKHHEGFCMWQTAVQSFKDYTGSTLYDLPDYTPFGSRDILKELKDSCDAAGIKFCLYYSILDWNHSSQTIYNQNYSTMASDSARASYILDMKSQLSELITKYHPAIMWFDGDWTYNSGTPTPTSWWTKADGIDLYNYLIGLDPDLLINERVCRGFGIGDYECPEQQVPPTPRDRPWETNQTMNNSWGYNQGDNSYKTLPVLVQQLATVVSRDGNYLLNIGPKGDGTVPSQSVNLLSSFGDWMNIYGESIYGTTRSPFKNEPKWGVYTKKEGKLYIHVFTWTSNGLLRVPSLSNTISKIYLMNDTTALLNYTDSSGCISISLPANAPNVNNSVIILDVAGLPTVSTEYTKVTRITVKSLRGIKTIPVGDTLLMAATITPTTASIKSVTWSVSDTTKASISSEGLLKAKKNGSVNVFATANDGTDIQGKVLISISAPTGVDDKQSKSLPKTPVLEQNYPNPFNPSTTFTFNLPLKSFVTIKIFDVIGREITTIVSDELSAGKHIQKWNAEGVTNGVYFYRIQIDDFIEIKKLMILK